MLATLRLFPALALAAVGYFAADALLKRSRDKGNKKDLKDDLKTWEGEGGNLPPGQPKAAGSPVGSPVGNPAV